MIADTVWWPRRADSLVRVSGDDWMLQEHKLNKCQRAPVLYEREVLTSFSSCFIYRYFVIVDEGIACCSLCSLYPFKAKRRPSRENSWGEVERVSGTLEDLRIKLRPHKEAACLIKKASTIDVSEQKDKTQSLSMIQSMKHLR